MLESGGVVILMHHVFSHMFQMKTQVSVVEDSLATVSYVFTRRWLFKNKKTKNCTSCVAQDSLRG